MEAQEDGGDLSAAGHRMHGFVLQVAVIRYRRVPCPIPKPCCFRSP